MMKTLFAALAVAFSARGADCASYYLEYGVQSNYVGTVTVDSMTCKVYQLPAGDRWAVLTGVGETLETVEVPASVTFEGVEYPVKALANNALGASNWKPDGNHRRIVLSNGIAEVGESAFAYCQALTNVLFGASLRSIGSSAFEKCYSLERVILPEGLVKIGASLFQSSAVKEVVFPSTVETLPDNTFNSCMSLQSVTLPETLKSIGHSAFYYCTKLAAINLPDSVTNLGHSAFVSCKMLTSIRLPAGLTRLENSMFDDCSLLETVHLPDSITAIGTSAFSRCPALASLTLPSLLRTIGDQAFASTGLVSISLPEGVESIGSAVFSGCGELTSITLPQSLRTIGGNAFWQCRKLESVQLSPSGLTGLAGSAFKDCSSLQSITIPSTLATIPSSAFEGCTALASVTFLGSVTSIGDSAFRNCPLLTGLVLPASLQTLGSGAFNGCAALTEIAIPAGVTTIGESVFANCSSLGSLAVENGNTAYRMRGVYLCTADGRELIAAPATLTEVVIPDGVETIRREAFCGCAGLLKLTIPGSVSSVGSSAFGGCNRISDLTLPGERFTVENLLSYSARSYRLTNVTVTAGTTALCDSFCARGVKVVRVTLPDSVRSIGSSAFSQCEALEGIELPPALTNLGQSVFAQSRGLREIAIPTGVRKIPQYCFQSCAGLERVTFAGDLESIGPYAFYHCEKLDDIDLPATLTRIGNNAFENCFEFESVSVPDGVTRIEVRTFYGCRRLCAIDLPESVTELAANAFDGCSLLASFRIPAAVRSIGESAFARCRTLSTLTVPDGVTEIPASVFSECSGLGSVDLPDTITSIGRQAFYNCTLLKSVRLPEGLLSIGNSAFMGSTSIKSLALPSTLATLGSGPFSGMTGLERIDVADGNGSYASIGGVLFNKALTELVHVPYLCKMLYLPAELTTLSTSLFSDRPQLMTVEVDPENQSYASQDGVLYNKAMTQVLFCGRGIASVEIADTCTDLPKAAFQNCPGLRSVIVPAQISPIRSYFDPSYRNLVTVRLKTGAEVPEGFCQACTDLEEVELPAAVTKIGPQAFRDCSSLRSFRMPDEVTEIGYYAFSGCSSLRHVDLGQKLERIGNAAFSGCNNLIYLELPRSVVWVGTNALSASSETLLFVDGPPPENIAQAGLINGDRVMRPRAYSNEWANAGLAASVHIIDMPEEGVTWTPDTSRDWDGDDTVFVHSGVIAEDEVWSAEKTHVVRGWVTVSNDVTVTVEKGAVVKFCDGMGLLLRNRSAFVGEGVTFTNIHDDEVGGDTDQDLGETPPAIDAYTIYGRVLEDSRTRYRSRLFRYYASSLGDDAWTEGNVYWLSGQVSLPKDRRLVIQAGAIVKMDFNSRLEVCGTLEVQGRRTNPVVFTSAYDDEYGGDTDGTDGSPIENCWLAVEAIDADAVLDIRYANFRYGGGRALEGYASMSDRQHIYAPVTVFGGEATLRGCTFTESRWGGIGLMGGRLTAVNCAFWNNEGCAVYSDGGEATVDASVIYRCLSTVGHQKNGTAGGRTVFRNCIVQEPGETWLKATEGVTLFDHCCFWGVGACPFAGANGNISADPLLVAPTEGDFRIGDESPCVDAGLPVSPAQDYYGQFRQNRQASPTGFPDASGRYHDIGLYEVMPLAGASDAADIEVYDLSCEPWDKTGDSNRFKPGDTLEIAYRVRNVSAATDIVDGERHDRIEFVTGNGQAYLAGESRESADLLREGKNCAVVRKHVLVPSMPTGPVSIRVTVNTEREVFEGLFYDNNRVELDGREIYVERRTFEEIAAHGVYTLPKGGVLSCSVADGVPEQTLLIVHAAANDRLRLRSGSGGQLPTETIRYAEGTAVGTDGDYILTIPEDGAFTIENLGGASVSFTIERGGSGLTLYNPYRVMKAVNTNYIYFSELCTYDPPGGVPGYYRRVTTTIHEQNAVKDLSYPKFYLKTAGKYWVQVATSGVSQVEFRFWGNCFNEDMQLALRSGGILVEPEETRVFSRYSGYAVFNLYGREPGEYRLEISRGADRDDTSWLELWEPVAYFDSGDRELIDIYLGPSKEKFKVNLDDFPNPLRANRVYDVTLGWKNDSTEETETDIFRIESTRSRVRFTEGSTWKSRLDFVPLGRERPFRMFQPLEEADVNFEFSCPGDHGYDRITHSHNSSSKGKTKKTKGGSRSYTPYEDWRRHLATVKRMMYAAGNQYPWAANEKYYRPADVGDELWGFIFAEVKSVYGLYRDEFRETVLRKAEQYAECFETPPPLVEVAELIQADVRRIMGDDQLVPTLVDSRDAEISGHGYPLLVDRVYATGLAGRFTSGLFGRGWHCDLDRRLLRHSDSQIFVGVPGRPKTYYTRTADGSEWENTAAPGASWLEIDPDTGTVEERFANGTCRSYDAEGRYLACVDAHGCGFTIEYGTGGSIDRIVHTDSTDRAIRFEYQTGTKGPCRLIGPGGRILAEYTYTTDGDDELLASVTLENGFRQQYGYRNRDSTAASLALNSIATQGFASRSINWNDAGTIGSITVDGRFVTEFLRDGDHVRVIDPNGYSRLVSYNPLGRVSSLTDELGYTTKFLYSEGSAAPTAVESPLGRRVGVEYSAVGDILKLTTPGGAVTKFSYDDHGFLSQVSNPDSTLDRRSCTAMGDLTSRLNAGGVARFYTYDDKGDLLTDLAVGNTRGFVSEYDGFGNRTALIATNTDDRADFTFDSDDRLVRAEDTINGAVTMAYDSSNRLSRVTTAEGHRLDLTYDGCRGPSSVVNENGAGERYVYDDLGRLSRVVDAQDASQVYLVCGYADGPSGDGRLISERFGNGMTTVYVYDGAGRVLAISTRRDDTAIADFRYSYDADGSLVSGGEVTECQVDDDGQLVSATYADGVVENFSYDIAGFHRLDGVEAVDDLETGHLRRLSVQGSGTYLCYYDSFDRLVAVSNSTLDVAWACEYDALGSRARVFAAGGTIDRVNIPGTNRLVDEYQNGSRIRHHVWANGRRIAVVLTDGTTRYLVSDNIGSVRKVVNDAGTVTGSASFRAFGELAESSGADRSLCGWCAAVGVETDVSGFHYMYNRYYSTKLRRFISEDPTLLLSGDQNLYRYCYNDPLVYCDPLGLGTGTKVAKALLKTVEFAADLIPVGKVLKAKNLKKAADKYEMFKDSYDKAGSMVSLATHVNKAGTGEESLGRALFESVVDMTPAGSWRDMYKAWDEVWESVFDCP